MELSKDIGIKYIRPHNGRGRNKWLTTMVVWASPVF